MPYREPDRDSRFKNHSDNDNGRKQTEVAKVRLLLISLVSLPVPQERLLFSYGGTNSLDFAARLNRS